MCRRNCPRSTWCAWREPNRRRNSMRCKMCCGYSQSGSIARVLPRPNDLLGTKREPSCRRPLASACSRPHRSGSRVPMDAEPLRRAAVPFRTHLQQLLHRCRAKVRRDSWSVAWNAANLPLPPVSSGWIRPAVTGASSASLTHAAQSGHVVHSAHLDHHQRSQYSPQARKAFAPKKRAQPRRMCGQIATFRGADPA